jgi:hypothetical protein
MKKLIISLLFIPFILAAQNPLRLPYQTLLQTYSGDTSKVYFSGDSLKWYTNQSFFQFNKSFVLPSGKIIKVGTDTLTKLSEMRDYVSTHSGSGDTTKTPIAGHYGTQYDLSGKLSTSGTAANSNQLQGKDSTALLSYTKALTGAKQNQLNGTGFVKASGTSISYDNSTYLTGSGNANEMSYFTGASAITGASGVKYNSSLKEIELLNNNVTTNSASSLKLSNHTRSTVSIKDQYSPYLSFKTSGWNTTGGTNSTYYVRQLVKSISGTTAAFKWSLDYSTDSITWTEKAYINQGGSLTLQGGISSYQISATGDITSRQDINTTVLSGFTALASSISNGSSNPDKYSPYVWWTGYVYYLTNHTYDFYTRIETSNSLTENYQGDLKWYRKVDGGTATNFLNFGGNNGNVGIGVSSLDNTSKLSVNTDKDYIFKAKSNNYTKVSIDSTGKVTYADGSEQNRSTQAMTVSYSKAIPFNRVLSDISTHTLTGNDTLTVNTTNAFDNAGAQVLYINNSINTPNLDAFHVSGTYDNTKAYSLLTFIRKRGLYIVSILNFN